MTPGVPSAIKLNTIDTSRISASLGVKGSDGNLPYRLTLYMRS